MLYSRMSNLRVYAGRTIRVDRDTIFLVIPDINVDNVYRAILNSGFLLTNCSGIISPVKVLTTAAFGKKFNARLHYYDLKKEMTVEKPATRKIKVLAGLNPQLIQTIQRKEKTSLRNEATLYFYNCAVLTQVLRYFLEKLTPKLAFLYFFRELENVRKSIKDVFPTLDVDLLFISPNTEGVFYEFFTKKARVFFSIDDFSSLNLFDNRGLLSNGNNHLITVLVREKRNLFLVQNLSKINTLYEEEHADTTKRSDLTDTGDLEDEGDEEETVKHKNLKKKMNPSM